MAASNPIIEEALGRAFQRALGALTDKQLHGGTAALGTHLHRSLAAEGLEVHPDDDTVRMPVLRLSEIEQLNGA